MSTAFATARLWVPCRATTAPRSPGLSVVRTVTASFGSGIGVLAFREGRVRRRGGSRSSATEAVADAFPVRRRLPAPRRLLVLVVVEDLDDGVAFALLGGVQAEAAADVGQEAQQLVEAVQRSRR